MKISNIVLIFIIFALPIVVKNIAVEECLEQKVYNKIYIDRVVDSATDDAVEALIAGGELHHVLVDYKAASETFLETLYENFGAEHSDVKQAIVNLYVPVFIVMDYDGYYVMQLMTYRDNSGEDVTKHVWSERHPYAWCDSNYIIGFTMDDWVTIYEISSGETIEGFYSEVMENLEETPFQDVEEFEIKRYEIITHDIENAMRSAINEHNVIAHRYGITYEFDLPVMENRVWSQCISDVGILTLVQGLPMNMAGDYYNQFSVGGGAVYKVEPVYVETDALTGMPYYHMEGCSHVTQDSVPYVSAREAAKAGAKPCEVCIP